MRGWESEPLGAVLDRPSNRPCLASEGIPDQHPVIIRDDVLLLAIEDAGEVPLCWVTVSKTTNTAASGPHPSACAPFPMESAGTSVGAFAHVPPAAS